MGIKVSVILPSLNVAEYIEECLESVIHQTLKDIEIICVDAGSLDGTLEKIREYERQDKRVKVILSDKKSYGYQMNLGMDAAEGEYIGIVETDDYILPEMYEELYHTAKKQNADFVKSDFYRFTKEGTEADRALFKLTDDKRYYHRIIDVEKEQECFLFPMNTWSGIYKREFLKVHTIRHNETPGASYQDTGFWFQTFIYARRACFSDKACYMNRRDNPGSSVYRKDKVFCVCDEYRFILQILKKDAGLYERYKYRYACSCYESYKGTLWRIEEKYKLQFLQRFADDFRRLRDAGALCKEYFSEGDWEMLRSIMEEPSAFYANDFLRKQKVYKEIIKYDSVIIYGVGMVGKKVYEDIVAGGNRQRIVCFAVTDKEKNFDSYEGIPVLEITDLTDRRKDSLIVIATTSIYHKEIKEKLTQLGFWNVIPMPACGL